jgi:hypothetical protein
MRILSVILVQGLCCFVAQEWPGLNLGSAPNMESLFKTGKATSKERPEWEGGASQGGPGKSRVELYNHDALLHSFHCYLIHIVLVDDPMRMISQQTGEHRILPLPPLTPCIVQSVLKLREPLMATPH